MDQIIQTGRTVEEAEELALAALGADRSEVEVETLNRGRQGFLGIGGEMAEVRVTRTTPAASPEPDVEAHADAGPDADYEAEDGPEFEDGDGDEFEDDYEDDEEEAPRRPPVVLADADSPRRRRSRRSSVSWKP